MMIMSEIPDYHLRFRPLGFIPSTKHFTAKENFDICLFSFCLGAFMIRDKCLPPCCEKRGLYLKKYIFILAHAYHMLHI